MSSVTEEEFRQEVDHEKSDQTRRDSDEFTDQQKLAAYGYFSDNMRDIDINLQLRDNRGNERELKLVIFFS